MSFTPSGSPEFHDAVTNTVTSHIREMGALRRERAALDREKARQDADHDEMMRYIAELNKLRDKYSTQSGKVAEYEAGYNELAAILKEHLHEMSISKDEVNQRVNTAMDKALDEHKRRQGA